jgi:hypothetical protein
MSHAPTARPRRAGVPAECTWSAGRGAGGPADVKRAAGKGENALRAETARCAFPGNGFKEKPRKCRARSTTGSSVHATRNSGIDHAQLQSEKRFAIRQCGAPAGRAIAHAVGRDSQAASARALKRLPCFVGRLRASSCGILRNGSPHPRKRSPDQPQPSFPCPKRTGSPRIVLSTTLRLSPPMPGLALPRS